MTDKLNDSNGEFEMVDTQEETTSPAVPTAWLPQQNPPQSGLSFPPPPLPNPYNSTRTNFTSSTVRGITGPPALPVLPISPPSSFPPPNSSIPQPPVATIPTQPPLTAPKDSSYEVSLDAVPITCGGSTEGEEGNSVWGWIPGGGLLSKMAEKAKSQMDSVITTLDPQMKDYMHTSGSIEVAVASDKETKIAAVREGFTRVFSHVTARGFGAPSAAALPIQPVGFSCALKAAETRVEALKNSRLIPSDIPLIAVEGFLIETVPNTWHEMAILLMVDDTHQIKTHVVSQSTPVPLSAIQQLKERSSSMGDAKPDSFNVSIGEVMAHSLATDRREWHLAQCGCARRDILASAAASLAGTYKRLRQ